MQRGLNTGHVKRRTQRAPPLHTQFLPIIPILICPVSTCCELKELLAAGDDLGSNSQL
ncbi:BQ5605_C004g02884 [Microbotryum silenes-dioicae]|uniref:BQ5605_C004g02884 protein n=1 Tax=Microbotryum silenes-dioicae TaxID=796604 RepID=A0A2X0N354_9BASI|nr:BQ5605_C004g02884 [Microbotryum silenes-dioicae]